MVKYFAFLFFSDVAQEHLLTYFMPNIVWLQKDLKMSFMIDIDNGSLGYYW